MKRFEIRMMVPVTMTVGAVSQEAAEELAEVSANKSAWTPLAKLNTITSIIELNDEKEED